MIETFSQTHRHRSCGFSKAEVLVLLAIAAVIVALLVPALMPASSKVDEEATLARCKENLRQIGVALLAYAHDNHGDLPLSQTVDGPHPEFTHALLSTYLKDHNLLFCPSLKSPTDTPDNLATGTIGYFYYNATKASSNTSLSRFLLTGIEWPRYINADDAPDSWLLSDIWLSGEPTAHTGFRKGVNFLTLDGSVNFLTESPRKAFH